MIGYDIKNILHHGDIKILLRKHTGMMFYDLRVKTPQLKNGHDLSYHIININ
jgi:hypothetical protein